MQRIVPMIADEDAVTHAELERDGAVVRSRRRTRSTAVRSGTSRPASRRPDAGRTAPWVVDDLFVAADDADALQEQAAARGRR